MTPALKAMVEAMVAEAKRQDAAEAEVLEGQPWLSGEHVATEHQYRWEAVARAGLEAIGSAADEALLYEVGETLFHSPKDHLENIVGAILKDQP